VSPERRIGLVQLVGAGPGDPELITVKGLRCLQAADVVVHDRLVSSALVALAPPAARRIDVGKAPGDQRWPQSRINTLIVAEARRGRRVVRLKGGDPFVFGRGGEECQALAEAGIPFEVVPGVSSAVAAPAYAGIPVSHRSFGSSFTVVSGHAREGGPDADWERLARLDTLVVLMGLGRLARIVSILLQHGRPASTPVAIVSRATAADQTVVHGVLGDIVERARGVRPPATIVVGQVARLGRQLAWLEPHEPDGEAAQAKATGERRGRARPRTNFVA
jgi:uroporphyrin-III C-methyltransferase